MSSKGTDGAGAPIADAPDLRSLIERLEAATEGSRYLDVEIACAVPTSIPGYPKYEYTVPMRIARGWESNRIYVCDVDGDLTRESHLAPNYTTSIDAALTLVPEGWVVANLYQHLETKRWLASVGRLNKEVGTSLFAATAAIAFCIAALKARQAAGQGGRTGSGEAASVPNPEVSK
jgi:hypothetical protein